MGRLIIGLGSGRCGTESFANLLNRQSNVSVTHEGCSLPWEFYQEAWDWNMRKLNSGKPPWGKEIVGDVGYYWVNYVERLLNLRPDTKFICLKRDREAVMDSYMVKSSGLNVHPADDWFRMFPRYNLPAREAVGAMWDDYYKISEGWEGRYPESFKIMDMDEVLNTEDGMRRMFDFLQIENPVMETGIRLNRGQQQGGNEWLTY